MASRVTWRARKAGREDGVGALRRTVNQDLDVGSERSKSGGFGGSARRRHCAQDCDARETGTM